MKSGAVCADNWIVSPEDWGLYKYNQHYKWIVKDIATLEISLLKYMLRDSQTNND